MTLQEMINRVGSNPTLGSKLLKTEDGEKVFDDIYRVIGVEFPHFKVTNSVSEDISYRINGVRKEVHLEANVPTKVLVEEELRGIFDMMFYDCSNITSLDLSHLLSHLTYVRSTLSMFANCTNLQSIIFGKNFDISKFSNGQALAEGMFYNCYKLNHIKCTQAFKDWCIANQNENYLSQGGNSTILSRIYWGIIY